MFKSQFLSLSCLTASTVSLVALSSFANPVNAATINKITDWQIFEDGSSSENSINLSTPGLEQNASSIANFLGISNADLENLAIYNAVGGSAAKTSINVEAGDVLNFDWFFRAGDPFPFNDFSFWTLNNTANFLVDILHIQIFGSPTSGSVSYTFDTSGTYTLGFGVLDSFDEWGDSSLIVNNVTTTSVPEPATVLGVLGVGSLLAATKKRNSSKKA